MVGCVFFYVLVVRLGRLWVRVFVTGLRGYLTFFFVVFDFVGI